MAYTIGWDEFIEILNTPVVQEIIKNFLRHKQPDTLKPLEELSQERNNIIEEVMDDGEILEDGGVRYPSIGGIFYDDK